jgi:hypothetical protein
VGGARLKSRSARTLHPDFLIVWMNSLFWHLKNLSYKAPTLRLEPSF